MQLAPVPTGVHFSSAAAREWSALTVLVPNAQQLRAEATSGDLLSCACGCVASAATQALGERILSQDVHRSLDEVDVCNLMS
jgi:hypothetical protein